MDVIYNFSNKKILLFGNIELSIEGKLSMDEDKFELFTDEDGELYLEEDGFVVEVFNPDKGWIDISKPYPAPVVGNTVSFERMLSIASGVKPNRLQ